MAGKRSKRKHAYKFPCPFCGLRLYRLGSTKYHLFYEGTNEITKNTALSRKQAALVATKGIFIDSNHWIEEFFCGEHGNLWIVIRRSQEGEISYLPAQREDWKHTTKTIDPDLRNPSVSEFSYYMSRNARVQS